MSPDRRLTPNVKIDLSNWTIAWVKPGYTREVINTRTYNKGNNLLSQYNQYMNIWPCYRYNIHYKLEIKHCIHFFSFLYIVICLCNVNNSLHIMHLKGIYYLGYYCILVTICVALFSSFIETAPKPEDEEDYLFDVVIDDIVELWKQN